MPTTSLARIVEPEVQNIDGKIVATSLNVAWVFQKRHDSVLRSIKELLEGLEKQEEITDHYFVVSDYKDSTGCSLTCYNCTKRGFDLLAMGFIGKKVASHKGTL